MLKGDPPKMFPLAITKVLGTQRENQSISKERKKISAKALKKIQKEEMSRNFRTEIHNS